MGKKEANNDGLTRRGFLNQRVKNTILGTLVYGLAGIVVTAILNGEPVWNLVIGSAIAGFLIYAFIYPALEKKKRKKI